MKSTQNKINTEPTLLTIFGITGDLTRIKLLPALYQLERKRQLPKNFYIVGVTRKKLDILDLRADLVQEIEKTKAQVDQRVLDTLFARFYIAQFEITKDEDYPRLREFLNEIEDKKGVCFNRLFYLAIPPTLFASVIEKLGKGSLHLGCQHGKMQGRLLIEKPFGFDVPSAEGLITTIRNYFKESQVYRVDHYLAKETVLNILKFRFENPLVESIWNKDFIDHVQITAAEEIGIGSRISFFEQTGALRDMIQSHLLQILALIAMEQPKSQNSSEIHANRMDLLGSLKPIKPMDVDKLAVRGQYIKNRIGTKEFSSYREKVNNSRSITETYAALKINIDNKRWSGVPFIVRAGKRLPQKVTDITLVFKGSKASKNINTLTIRIQPNEGIGMNLLVKKPGLEDALEPAQMQFCYDQTKSEEHLDAHARLMLNASRGDQTLFPSSNEVMASWKFIEPVLHHWQQSGNSLEFYKAGTWGPPGANKLLAPIHGDWLASNINICMPKIEAL